MLTHVVLEVAELMKKFLLCSLIIFISPGTLAQAIVTTAIIQSHMRSDMIACELAWPDLTDMAWCDLAWASCDPPWHRHPLSCGLHAGCSSLHVHDLFLRG